MKTSVLKNIHVPENVTTVLFYLKIKLLISLKKQKKKWIDML